MKKMILLTLLSGSFIASSYASNVLRTAATTETQDKIAATYNVRIELKDWYSGAPVSAGTLRGYKAYNQQTGQLYESSRDGNTFEGLPAGTYRFTADAGPWDGAVPSTVTLSQGAVGSDGYIVVTLGYWKE